MKTAIWLPPLAASPPFVAFKQLVSDMFANMIITGWFLHPDKAAGHC